MKNKMNNITLGDVDKIVAITEDDNTSSDPVVIGVGKDAIEFNPKTHEYTRKGSLYTPVSNILKQYGFGAVYDGIPTAILDNAAKRGTKIHKDLEQYLKDGVTGIGTLSHVDLVDNYFQLRMVDPKTAISEKVYFDDTYKVAGTVDLQYFDGNDDVLADFKTTSQIHYDAVSWQLSIYAYLITGGDIMSYYFKQLKVFHLTGGKLTVKDIPTIDIDAVKGLLEANLQGDPTYTYVKNTTNLLPPSDKVLLTQIMREIETLEAQKKVLIGEKDKLADRIKQAMIDNKETIIDTDTVRVAYVGPIARTSFDTKKVDQLINAHNLNRDDFLKTSISADGLRISLKKAPTFNDINDGEGEDNDE